jgi:predicted flavoprotein YhiN
MAPLLKDYRLTLTAEPERGRAQVMRGGFATGGFDPLTLGSTVHPGLYAAGECLDIDGPCGGYNLHWAFASGLVAGEASGRGA